MGNNPSKPTEHVFYGETPVQFSHNLVNALESSVESDSIRSKSSSLHIQQLVNSELQRLQVREDSLLQSLSPSTDSIAPPDDMNDPLAVSRIALQSKISGIKERLGSVPGSTYSEEDDETKRARGEVVRCLSVNDRRPLECWAEVEKFREMARRREGGFVTGVVGRG